jgi:hypothetical protein
MEVGGVKSKNIYGGKNSRYRRGKTMYRGGKILRK